MVMEGKRLSREQLVATVAVLQGSGLPCSLDAWDAAEAFVAALELFPQNTAKCPCCTKQVTLCVKHYLLHGQGKPCRGCREDE
jgi:hypothetical protein